MILRPRPERTEVRTGLSLSFKTSFPNPRSERQPNRVRLRSASSEVLKTAPLTGQRWLPRWMVGNKLPVKYARGPEPTYQVRSARENSMSRPPYFPGKAILAWAFGLGAFALAGSARAGDFSLLHDFQGSDGGQPFGGVIRDSAGNLYGTTVSGGDGCKPFGCGTIFKLAPENASNHHAEERAPLPLSPHFLIQ